MAAGSGFEQKKMSDPTLGSDSYDQIRFKVGQNPDVLTKVTAELNFGQMSDSRTVLRSNRTVNHVRRIESNSQLCSIVRF